MLQRKIEKVTDIVYTRLRSFAEVFGMKVRGFATSKPSVAAFQINKIVEENMKSQTSQLFSQPTV